MLSGTPTAAGTASFTVNVTDTAGATLAQTYTLTVNAALTIGPAALADATAGAPTNQTITVSNGTTALHDPDRHQLRRRRHRTDGRQFHAEPDGGNRGALRHADGGGDGHLHG